MAKGLPKGKRRTNYVFSLGERFGSNAYAAFRLPERKERRLFQELLQDICTVLFMLFYLLPRSYQNRTNPPHLDPFQQHSALWFLVGLRCWK
jgi:hypothetical protein